MATLAAIALDKTSYSFDTTYTYVVPEHLVSAVFEGCRVLVPFGRGNAKRQGVILSLTQGDSDGKKVIFSVLDQKRYLNDELLRLIPFLKQRYFCTYFDALKTVLPKGINYRTNPYYLAVAEMHERSENLSGDEKRIYDFLFDAKEAVSESKILSSFSLQEDTLLHNLLKNGYILKDNRADRNRKDVTQKMLKFLLTREEYVTKRELLSKKQTIVADFLVDVSVASLKEVMYFCAVTKAVPDALVKKGIAAYYDAEVNFAEQEMPQPHNDITLSQAQQAAYDEILSHSSEGEKGHCALLFGVTGSGKTQVYLKLIDQVISEGKSVIVMVPEISLTPQTIAIFKRRYANAIAVFHSRLSAGQRMQEWKRVQANQAKIVVGTRSAVFAPFDNLGLIIIDEEQEHTYKSEMTPRYDAKEVAKFRCAYHQALLVLSSATPSVEDYAKALNGQYILAEIPERYGEATLPEVITVDMRDEKDDFGKQKILSDRLRTELLENLQKGEQSILLLNRRGFHTFVSCSDCGEVLTCPHCSVSLTYHRANGRLMCHFCGYSTTLQTTCPHCNGQAFSLSGYGTQRIETELEQCVPGARILRMDADTTLSKLSHEQMLEAFARGDYDILIGTQMVAKGFDFPNVTLAAVVNADQTLYNYDYRCSENTFDMVTQVIGRSGRGDKKGRAVIQTSTPDNPVLRLASTQNYPLFYQTEIKVRELMIYPPYCDLCLVSCSCASEAQAANAAKICFELIKKLNSTDFTEQKIMILGPAAAKVTKANNKYRYRLIIKCKNSPRLREMIHHMLIEAGNHKEMKNTTVIADINPVDIM